MLYRLTTEVLADRQLPPAEGRRFVLHRHHDAAGPHLDLRLEEEGYLVGFRVDGPTLGPESWATLKAPHPVHWLEQDGDAIREDGGAWHWEHGGPEGGAMLLVGQAQTVRVTLQPQRHLGASTLATLRSAADRLGVDLAELAALAEDGRAARDRAIARFRGLGRELDGDRFDGDWWRGVLQRERLATIQQHLDRLEERFDQRHPPQPTSRPAPLDDPEEGEALAKADRALGILRG